MHYLKSPHSKSNHQQLWFTVILTTAIYSLYCIFILLGDCRYDFGRQHCIKATRMGLDKVDNRKTKGYVTMLCMLHVMQHWAQYRIALSIHFKI